MFLFRFVFGKWRILTHPMFGREGAQATIFQLKLFDTVF
jgi:hypothetical protein